MPVTCHPQHTDFRAFTQVPPEPSVELPGFLQALVGASLRLDAPRTGGSRPAARARVGGGSRGVPGGGGLPGCLETLLRSHVLSLARRDESASGFRRRLELSARAQAGGC